MFLRGTIGRSRKFKSHVKKSLPLRTQLDLAKKISLLVKDTQEDIDLQSNKGIKTGKMLFLAWSLGYKGKTEMYSLGYRRGSINMCKPAS